MKLYKVLWGENNEHSKYFIESAASEAWDFMRAVGGMLSLVEKPPELTEHGVCMVTVTDVKTNSQTMYKYPLSKINDAVQFTERTGGRLFVKMDCDGINLSVFHRGTTFHFPPCNGL